jgi:hypothetical protein
MQKEHFRQFQTIFKAGDKAGKVYLLVNGSVGIFLPDNDTKDPNFFIKENEIFGEMGVIDDTLRMADARAMEECELVSLGRDEFEKMLQEHFHSCSHRCSLRAPPPNSETENKLGLQSPEGSPYSALMVRKSSFSALLCMSPMNIPAPE